MTMGISIKKNKNTIFEIEEAVFKILFDHTIARRKTKFVKCVSRQNDAVR